MTLRRMGLLGSAVVVAVGAPLAACVPAPAAKAPATTRALAGAPKCYVLPANSVWHADVSKLPVNAHSAAWLASSNAGSVRLHPDFGGPYGIPYTVVAGTHPKVPVRFDYAGESDRVGYPLGTDTRSSRAATPTRSSSTATTARSTRPTPPPRPVAAGPRAAGPSST